ncbi:MAG: NADPH-dependent 7-cyano-7-deazaguanine reductase QueF [Proteobacteria bacterium]|nr:NADPH-dependent 7-cyano-7-deazaguanine reductase QueF [Pseudomonadota bacterium]
MTTDSPLGKPAAYPRQYSPESLHSIVRADDRAALGIAGNLPFHGCDLWNAWELTWLSSQGLPQVVTAEIRVPVDSPNIIESKSLKIYLNSFAMTNCSSIDTVTKTIADDLGACTGSDVDVRLSDPQSAAGIEIEPLPGDCLDARSLRCDRWEVDAGLLQAAADDIISEQIHSHLLRSLCPVTNQPDFGSVAISYHGPRIDRDSLLRYIVSYRQHRAYHESCVERMFLDIQERCQPDRLTVYARYQRRGGIDINPFRSNFEPDPPNSRLWRQ